MQECARMFNGISIMTDKSWNRTENRRKLKKRKSEMDWRIKRC